MFSDEALRNVLQKSNKYLTKFAKCTPLRMIYGEILESHFVAIYRACMTINQAPITDMQAEIDVSNAETETAASGTGNGDWNTNQRSRLKKIIEEMYGPDEVPKEVPFGDGIDVTPSSDPTIQRPRMIQKTLFHDDDSRTKIDELLSGEPARAPETDIPKSIHPHDDPMRQGKIEQGRKNAQERKRRLRHGF